MNWRTVVGSAVVAIICFFLGSFAVGNTVQETFAASKPVATQRSHNSATREAWELFSNHRSHTTRLPLSVVPKDQMSPRLMVLGAGNCNDLALSELLPAFSSIHLCDVDGQALTHGMAQVGTASRHQVVTHVADVTGIFPLLEALKKPTKDSPQAKQMQGLAEALLAFDPRSLSSDFQEGFEVVLSSSMLSQIIVAVGAYVANEALGPLQIQVRDGHLQTMVRLLKPGGVGVLVSDFVATDSFPALWGLEDASLTPAVLSQLLASKNFFTGCHPTNVLAKLRSPPFAKQVANVTLVDVWKWRLSRERQYAVAAITFRKLLI